MSDNNTRVWMALHNEHHKSEDPLVSIPRMGVQQVCEQCETLAQTALKALGKAGWEGSNRLIESALAWANKRKRGAFDSKDMELYDSIKVLQLHADTRFPTIEAAVEKMGIASSMTGWSARGVAYEILKALDGDKDVPVPPKKNPNVTIRKSTPEEEARVGALNERPLEDDHRFLEDDQHEPGCGHIID